MDWFCNSEKAKEHKRTCTKNSWECGKCIWIDESSHAMSKYGNFVQKEEKKQKTIQTDEVISEFDSLAKDVVKVSEEFDHPLYHEIIRVFRKK